MLIILAISPRGTGPGFRQRSSPRTDHAQSSRAPAQRGCRRLYGSRPAWSPPAPVCWREPQSSLTARGTVCKVAASVRANRHGADPRSRSREASARLVWARAAGPASTITGANAFLLLTRCLLPRKLASAEQLLRGQPVSNRQYRLAALIVSATIRAFCSALRAPRAAR
jgi:hypothetical protein